MAKKIRVVKKNRVRMGPPIQLPLGRSPVGSIPTEIQGAAGGAAQARIVESNSDYVILEMVCNCGRKSYVQCNYGNVVGSQDVQEMQS